MKPFLFLALLFTVPAIASEPESSSPDNFAEHFYDEANVLTYIHSVDSLLSGAIKRKYESIEEMTSDAQLPQIITPNGIKMVFTVVKVEDSMQFHLSMSRAEYLARPFGKHLVGLLMVRAGLNKPSSFLISSNQVFHADWILDGKEFAEIAKKVSDLKIESIQDSKPIFFRALLKSGELR